MKYVFLENSCPHREVSSNLFQKPSKQSWKAGDNVTYSCQRGYVVNGMATSTCGLDGKWTTKVPSCESSLFYEAFLKSLTVKLKLVNRHEFQF